ncbi:MAG: 50S ribosomal protein L35 [Candidatus Hydrothermota bacterium]|nr:MAG: 50S ribosomal protein L35 [Candidatus Hydrothermae bacterium]
MPKMKTKRAAAKRFRITGGGKVRRFKAFHGHLLSKKSRKRKRALRQAAVVHKTDIRRLKVMLPYAW